MKYILLLIMALSTAAYAAVEKPNIILIISDDQGFPDYGFMGSKLVQTPRLDRMASEGLVYTRDYTMPACSPSLASLLTGKLPHQHGITPLFWSLSQAPAGMTLNAQAGLVQWMPASPNASARKATLAVTDGKERDTQTFEISSPMVKANPQAL